jgi:hypothetical protein
MKVLPPAERLERVRDMEDAPAPTDTLLVWEPPRRGNLYVIAADISSGMKLDYSVADVLRVGTLRECDEQVAQYITNTVDETDFANILDAIGRLYMGKDTLPAMIAVETNGMGMATQKHLLKVIGYPNIYLWRYWDVTPEKEITQRYGWVTSNRSRPIMLQHYVHAIKSVDPHTGLPDYRINSPHTISEMASFQSPGPLWMAEAVDGAHDDCIMAGAISVIVASQIREDLGETVHDARRRLSEEKARVEEKQDLVDRKISYQNSDTSADELAGRDSYEEDDPEAFRPPHYL